MGFVENFKLFLTVKSCEKQLTFGKIITDYQDCVIICLFYYRP